jgi:hypothetical protein
LVALTPRLLNSAPTAAFAIFLASVEPAIGEANIAG